MASEWTQLTVNEFAEVTDYVANGSFAKLRENVQYLREPDYAILVRLADYKSGWDGDFVYVSESSYKFLRKSILKPGDVIVSNVGAYAGTVFLAPDLGKPITLGPNALVIHPRGHNEYDRLFLYYYLSSPVGQNMIHSLITGSAQPKFNKTDLRRARVNIPARLVRQAIAHILGTLDNKIELNRRMNATLEAMAQAIFKSWFVDFDPVRAKAEDHQPYGMDEATAAMFPNGFEDSELGPVPRGWEVKAFHDFVTQSNEKVGNRDAPEYSSTNEGLKPRAETFKKQLSKSKSNNKLIRKHDLVFGLSRQVLNFGLMGDLIGAVSPAYKVYSIDTSVIISDYVETYMRVRENYYYNIISSSSREGQSISADHFLSMGLLIPPKSIQGEFQKFHSMLTRIIDNNNLQSRTLASLRDTLLPKLLSGEVRVREAEKIVERI